MKRIRGSLSGGLRRTCTDIHCPISQAFYCRSSTFSSCHHLQEQASSPHNSIFIMTWAGASLTLCLGCANYGREFSYMHGLTIKLSSLVAEDSCKGHTNHHPGDSDRQVYGSEQRESTWTHELAAVASSFVDMKAWEDHQRKEGTFASHS